MKRAVCLIGIALSLFSGTVAFAGGTDRIDLKNTPFSFERTSDVMPVFREITGRKVLSHQLSHSLVDLNGDDVTDILFQETGSCLGAFTCRTTLATWSEDGWKPAGEFYSHLLNVTDEVESGYRVIEAHYELDIGSRGIRYSWAPELSRYAVDLSPYGDRVDWEDAKTAFLGQEDFLDKILQRDLGQSYLFLNGATSRTDEVLVGAADLNGDEVPEYFLLVKAATVCTDSCPLFVYRDLSERPFARLASDTSQVVVASGIEEGKLRAIYVQSSDGSAMTYGWSADSASYEKL